MSEYRWFITLMIVMCLLLIAVNWSESNLEIARIEAGQCKQADASWTLCSPHPNRSRPSDVE